MSENLEHLLQQLEEKVNHELENKLAYEALQYVQSFVARKKKNMGQKGTSQAVFLGAKLLLQNAKANLSTAQATSASGTPWPQTLAETVGALLKWFIEDGAGSEYIFHLYTEQVNKEHYCDIHNLLDLFNTLEIELAGPIVNIIYNPLHVLLTKSKIKKPSPLAQRINKLEIYFANVLLASKHFLSAFKAYVRLHNEEKVAEVLNTWSKEGYKHEKPLFFARGLLQLLLDNKIEFANEVLRNSTQYIEDNIGLGKTSGGPQSPALAVWHVATILTELANFPSNLPRVDKTKLFGLLYRRYAPLFSQLDVKLLELFSKVGEQVFRYRPEGAPEPQQNPMAAMLQNLLGGAPPGGAGFPGGFPGMMPPGAAPGRGNNALPPSNPQAGRNAPRGPTGPGGMDLNTLMNMMSRLQQQ
jgi:hypothetical protein